MESSLTLTLVALALSAIAFLLGLWAAIWRAKAVDADIRSKLDQITSDVGYLAQYLKIGKGIYDYGSRIRDAYDDFMTRIEDEFKTLEQGQIEGREYVLRSSMLLFSLMMARVYLDAVGPRDSVPEVERYIERAKKIA
jgi:hypothetical protein